MIFIISITIVCAIFICIDVIPIYRGKHWVEFWIYLFLMTSVYVFVILIASGVKIPSPAAPLKKIVSFIWGLGINF